MSIKTDKAAQNNQKGYNCAQAVACAFAEEMEIDRRIAPVQHQVDTGHVPHRPPGHGHTVDRHDRQAGRQAKGAARTIVPDTAKRLAPIPERQPGKTSAKKQNVAFRNTECDVLRCNTPSFTVRFAVF